MSIWEDTTSYSRSDPQKTPSAYTLRLKDSIRIVVHRLHGIANQWFWSFYGLQHDREQLQSVEIEKAQFEALCLLQKELADVLQRVNQAIETERTQGYKKAKSKVPPTKAIVLRKGKGGATVTIEKRKDIIGEIEAQEQWDRDHEIK